MNSDLLTELMSSIFKIPKELINSESSSDTIESWDSLGHLRLILEIENKFGLKIPSEQIPLLTTYQKLLLVINQITDQKSK